MTKLIDQLKRWWLRKKYGNPPYERSFLSVRKAGKMGVLYRADQEYSQALIKKLASWCEEHHLRLIAMGYVDDKELVGDYTPHRNSDFFCNRHLNRWKLPNRSEFWRYSAENMDYLLNLYCEPCLPLIGLSSFSEARFRVGPHLPPYAFGFDLMLETKTKDVLIFTDEVLAYLTTFGNGKI